MAEGQPSAPIIAICMIMLRLFLMLIMGIVILYPTRTSNFTIYKNKRDSGSCSLMTTVWKSSIFIGRDNSTSVGLKYWKHQYDVPHSTVILLLLAGWELVLFQV